MLGSRSTVGEAAKGLLPGSEQSVSFEVKLTFVTLLVLFYPVVLCVLLHSKYIVQYLFGPWSLYTAVVVPLWVLMCHFAILNRVLSFRVAPICMIITPTAFLACACQIQAWQFNGQESALRARDCQSFLVKAKLDMAWWKAHDIFMNCTSEMSRITGASIEETRLVTRIMECRGYQEALDQYGKEWNFLEHMEQTHRCGGWCSVQMPIWKQMREPSDSCSVAVARQLVGNISLMGFQVTVYCGILLFCACVVLLMYPGWFLGLK